MEATKPSEWKKSSEDIKTLELPSGRVMKLKRPAMAKLIRQGLIPTHCYKVAMGQVDLSNPKNVDPETLKAVIDLMSIYISVAAVEPKVVMKDPVPADAIHIDSLDDDDLTFIFTKVGGDRVAGGKQSGNLDGFSEKPEGSADRPASQEVQSETVKPA